ncbi:MAG: nucleotidyltransferase domain-containing protein [Betaproteobacteria bacterium]|nr:nucleotidyltransferase domain-containing protein [Betaproteobacteria bacterium]
MRLSPEAIAIIIETVKARLGDEAQVRLFGSRLDDSAKGGDIDLHVSVNKPVSDWVWEAAQLAARLERLLDGRKVDVRLIDASQQALPIDRIAMQEGILLC